MHFMGIKGNVKLFNSMPHRLFYSGNSQNAENIKRNNDLLLKQVSFTNRLIQPAKIESVHTYAEGTAISILMYDQYKTNSFILCDIGGKTTERVKFVNGQVDKELTCSYNIGIHNLYEPLRATLAQHVNSVANYFPTISNNALAQAIETKTLHNSGNEFDEFDIANIVNNFLRLLTNMIRDKFISNIDDSDVQKIVFTGGGAVLLEPFLRDESELWFPNSKRILILDEFSTARACHLIGEKI